MEREEDRFLGCLIGLACGDAVGTTLEFEKRGSFEPIKDMVGGGPFGLEAGQWTDDTSMALCLACSLIDRNGFDAEDQMKRYCLWWDEGYLSCTGECFDIGLGISSALNRFKETNNPFSGSTDPQSAGNGCIMRLAPIPMYFYPSLEETIYFAAESSKTTHGTRECIDACRLLGSMIYKALAGQPKDEILFGEYLPGIQSLSPRIAEISSGDYRDKAERDILGSGYVVKCLEAALWSFYHTDTFRGAVLKAVNLGDDADTTGAVCGQLAGAFYGQAAIPEGWRKKLAKKGLIQDVAKKLMRGG